MGYAPTDKLNPAWVATQAAKEVQGVATYLEFSGYEGSSVIQIVITPEMIDSRGKLVPAAVFRRQISTATPRKQWRSSSLFNMNHDVTYNFQSENLQQIAKRFQDNGFLAAEDDTKLLSLTRMEPFFAYFKQLGNRGYKLVKEMPLHAEVSKQDADSIASDKLPSKLMYRIQQVRLANGFPDPILKS